MIRREECAACGAGGCLAWPAVVSPFVAERLGVEAVPCRLLECRRCAHRSFDLALDDGESARFYADYRGAAYVAQRRRWEPWYTEAFQAAGAAPATVATRRRILGAYLRRWIPAGLLASGSLLDYGGDRGQFLPPELGAARYVFDLSNQPTAEGVHRISEPSALPAQRYDVVLLSHVLEHLSEPAPFLAGLAGALGPWSAGHWLYAEVPLERFRILARPTAGGVPTRPAPPRPTLPWLARDFYSTLLRVKLGVVPPLGVIKLHEHQGFFTEASLRALLHRAGYEVVDAGTASSEGSLSYGTVIRIVARQQAGGAGNGARGAQP